MACDTDRQYSVDSTSSKGRWIASMADWLTNWRRKYLRKQEIKELLSCNESVLDDIGLLRSELVSELGFDPHEIPPMYGASVYPSPFIGYESVTNSNHGKRRQ